MVIICNNNFDDNFQDNNYNKFIKEVNENKYDIVIGEFFTNNYREKLINFTTPISIDSNAVLHVKKNNHFSTVYKIFKKVIYQIIFLIISICKIRGSK